MSRKTIHEIRTTLMLLSALQRDYSSLATVYRQVNSANVYICIQKQRADQERERGQMYISLEEETRSTDNVTFFRASQTESFALTDDESFDVRMRPASYLQRCVAKALCHPEITVAAIVCAHWKHGHEQVQASRHTYN